MPFVGFPRAAIPIQGLGLDLRSAIRADQDPTVGSVVHHTEQRRTDSLTICASFGTGSRGLRHGNSMSAVATSAFEVLTDGRANLALDGRAAMGNADRRSETPQDKAGVKRSRTQAMEGHVMVVREQRFEPATPSKRVQRGNDERP